jgi:hypothetical protein
MSTLDDAHELRPFALDCRVMGENVYSAAALDQRVITRVCLRF